MSYYQKPVSVADRIAALKTSSTAGYSQSDAFKAAPKVERSTAESASASQPSDNIQDRWQRVQSASQSYRRTSSQDPEQEQEESSSSSGSSSESSSSSSESGSSSASPGTIPSLRLPGTLGSTPVVDAGIDNDQWQAAMDRYNQESTEPPAGENEGRFDAVGHLENSAANRQTGDTTSAVVASSPSAHHSTPHQTSSQEDQDLEYAKRLDMMGDPEDMGYGAQEQSTAPGAGTEEDLSTQEITDKLSLWGTFVVLYKRKPMLKYHLLALLVLLIAAAAIIGISVSSKNKDSSSNQDCSSASYVNEPILLLPSEGIPAGPGLTVSAGGFGTDVSASSDYLVIGAPNPTSTCTAPDQTACAYTIGGGAYLYRRSGNTGWKLYSSFILDDGISKGDEFGKAVGISEDSTTMVVGAPEDDGLGIVAGAVYVMETPFSETEAPIKLLSDDIGPNDNFGGSVSVSTAQLSGGVKVTNVIVGAQHDDDFGSKSGAVYVFSKFDGQPRKNACGGDITIEPGKFIQCQKLLPDDGETNDLFGRVVNVAGKTLVVGAMWDDDRGIDSGSAYVFSLDNNGSWSLQEKLLPINFESQANRFGISVATSGKRIIVGADLDDAQGVDSGAAYVYRISNGAWTFESKLIDQFAEAAFGKKLNAYECGHSVDISDDGKTILVGCPGAPGGGKINVYIFQDIDRRWAQSETFGEYPGSGLRMGGSTALSGVDGTTVVGYGKSNGEVFSHGKDC